MVRQAADVLVIHGAGFFNQSLADCIQVRSRVRGEREIAPAHTFNRPEKVDRRGTRGGQSLAHCIEVGRQLRERPGRAVLDPQGNAHGRRYSDRRSAAHHHRGDDVGYLLIGLGQNIGLFQRQLGLIEKANTCGGPFKGRNHGCFQFRALRSKVCAAV